MLLFKMVVLATVPFIPERWMRTNQPGALKEARLSRMCEAWGIHLFQITIKEIPGFLPRASIGVENSVYFGW
jgi:hypothetical protein